MINKIIINGENVELTEESKVPFTYTFAQAKTHDVKFGLDNTIEICAYAFQGCKNLTYIDIPEEIKLIKRCAFKDCTSLPKIVIKDSIEYVGKGVFDGCKNLKDITFKASNPPEWHSVIPDVTNIYVPNDEKFIPVDYEDMDMSGATQYYTKDYFVYTDPLGEQKTVDYKGYSEMSDVTMAEEGGEYFRNKWDTVADNKHTIEEKDRVKISSISFAYTNIRIKAGQSFDFAYTLSPANQTNNKVYWNIVNTDIASYDTEVEGPGHIMINTKAGKTGRTTITAISETTGATVTATLIIENPEGN